MAFRWRGRSRCQGRRTDAAASRSARCPHPARGGSRGWQVHIGRRVMTAEPTLPQLTIRAVRSVGVEVPMTFALGTSQARITRAPLLLIDVETEEGITGRAYLFCYLRPAAPAMAAMLDEIGRMVAGDRLVPAQLWGKLAHGFRAVKLRLGYPTLKEDLAAVHAVRRRIGDDVALMVDYNQALSVTDALERGRVLDKENIYWLE